VTMPKITETIRARLRAKTIDLPRPIYRYLLARGAIRTRPYRKTSDNPPFCDNPASPLDKHEDSL